MDVIKKKSVKDTFQAKLRTPWVWLILLLTIGLTVLFSLSQKPLVVVYSKYIQQLSDFQLMESQLMRTMDHVKMGFSMDSVSVRAHVISLREMAVSFSREMDELNAFGVQAPPVSVTNRYERLVLAKVASINRYTQARSAWMNSYHSLVGSLDEHQYVALKSVLDSARAGFPVECGQKDFLPDSLQMELSRLLSENAELAMVWSRFDNDLTLLSTAELVQFFQMERMNEMAMNAKIPLVFYFLTLVLLLSTFFFIFKSKL